MCKDVQKNKDEKNNENIYTATKNAITKMGHGQRKARSLMFLGNKCPTRTATKKGCSLGNGAPQEQLTRIGVYPANVIIRLAVEAEVFLWLKLKIVVSGRIK